MNALNLSPKNPAVLAVLVVGGLWLLSQRKAHAASRNALARTNAGFYVSPAVAAKVQPPIVGLGGVVTGVLDRLLNTRLGASSTTADGTAGDAAAQAYYQAHQQEFTSPDPFAVNPAPGVLTPNYGYVDPTEY